MKRIFVFSDLWVPFPGGAERYLANIAYELQTRGHEIHVLTSYEPVRDPRLSVTFRDIGVHERRALGVQALQEEIERFAPDVILTHHFFAYEFTAELMGFGLPVVQIIHNNVRLRGVQLAVYNSEFTKAHGQSHLDDFVIHPPAYQDIVAETHGQKIGFVKPIHHKGADYVYRLAHTLKHRQFLILRGEWPNGEDIRKMANVEFLQPVYDMRDFYQQCFLLLMPSWTEDAGTIPQEAAMNGLPCISTNVMGLAETNVAGIRLERHEHLWIEAIERCYKQPTFYKQIVARQKAQLPRFAWDRKFDDLSDRIDHL